MGRFRSGLPVIFLAIAVAGALVAAACTKEVEVQSTVVVERTVIVEKPVQQTVVVEKEKTVEKTVIVEKPVQQTVVVEKTVVVIQTATPLPATPTPTPKPKVPISWKIGMPSDVTTTNIWNIVGPGATAYNFYAFLNRYPSLYSLSDQGFNFVPSTAADLPPEVKQEGDKWTVTVKLKPGMKWTDGTDITSADFVFTVQTALDLKLTGNWSNNISPAVVDKAEAIDPQTIKITFKTKPGLAQWQYGLALAQFVQKKFWEPAVAEAKKAATEDDRRKAIYTAKADGEPTAGEALFQKWEAGAFVQHVKNPQYYWAGSTVKQYSKGGIEETTKAGTFKTGDTTGDVKLSLTRGPFFDTVTYNVYGSQDAAILALRAGDIDYFLSPLGLSQGLKAQVQGKPGVSTFQNPSNGFRYLGFNLRRAPMDDKAFRQAVAILIDKPFLTQSILQGAAEPIDTVVPKGNGAWHNASVPVYGKNADGSNMSREQRINAVVKLLKDNGYTWAVEPKWNAGDRKVDAGSGLKKGATAVKELEILAPSAGYDPLRATSAIWIEQWLKEAGIPVKATLTGFNPIVDKVFTQQDFDMWILGWGLTIYPNYLSDFFTSDHTAKDDNNAGGYSNPKFDAVAKAFLAETDLAKAKQQAYDLQSFLADELPYVTLFAVPILEVYRPDKIKFAYTDNLDGVQTTFQSINSALALTQFQ